ncbi:discoidin domain-containing protein, partial [Streptococcus himalayensis]
MSKDSKHLFSKNSKYALRKLSVGTASILVGYVLFSGAARVEAAEISTATPPDDRSTSELADREEKHAESSAVTYGAKPVLDASLPTLAREESTPALEEGAMNSATPREEDLKASERLSGYSNANEERDSDGIRANRSSVFSEETDKSRISDAVKNTVQSDKRLVTNSAATLRSTGLVGGFRKAEIESVEKTPDVNHLLGVSATASDTEVVQFSADKAVDGKENTRWATNLNVSNPTLTVNLAKKTHIERVELDWDPRLKDGQPDPNVHAWKLYASSDETVTEASTWTEIHSRVGAPSQHEQINVMTPVDTRHLKLVVEDYRAGRLNWRNVGIQEFRAFSNIYEDIERRPDINHLLNATATASDTEVAQFSADKAVDGQESTRWATNLNASNPTLTVNLAKKTHIERVELDWDPRLKAGQPDPNVHGWKLYASSDEHLTASSTWTEIHSRTGEPSQKERIQLTNPIDARHLKLVVEDYRAGRLNWRNVGIQEFRAFSNAQPAIRTLEDIQQLSLNEEGNQLLLPEVAGTLSIKKTSALPIIDTSGKIYQPLIDKDVKVYLEEKLADRTIEKEFVVHVVGRHPDEGIGDKPNVVPAVQEWHGVEGKTSITSRMRVQADSDFESVADKYKSDLAARGLRFETDVTDGPTLSFAKVVDKGYGREGYGIMISQDGVRIEAEDSVGAFYATRTLLQMGENNLQNGELRDYPSFEHRGFMLDTGRKFIPYETVMEVLENMAYYKLNDLQLHLNDNYIFLKEHIAGKNLTREEQLDYVLHHAKDGFRVETDVVGADGTPLTSKEHYTRAQMQAIIHKAQELGINLVPEIDTPGHALSFVKVRPDLMYQGSVGRHHDVERVAMLNLEDKYDETLAFVKSVYDKLLDGENAPLKGIKTIHIGTDEYYGNSESYRRYANDLMNYIKSKGLTPRIWGSLSIKTGRTPVDFTGSEVDIWNLGWQDPGAALALGAKIINILDIPTYSVPSGSGSRGGYGDYNDYVRQYNAWQPNDFSVAGGKRFAMTQPNILGGGYAVWNDNIDLHETGLTSYDIFKRFFAALPVTAQKTWGSSRAAQTYAELTLLDSEKKYAPATNPDYRISTEIYRRLTVDALKQLARQTEQGSPLVMTVAQKIQTSLPHVGPNAVLSLDVELTGDGVQLFSSTGKDKLYLADEDGRIGYQFEHMKVQFDTILPKNQRVKLDLVTKEQLTELYVNGEKQAILAQEAYPRLAHYSLVLPLEMIGGFNGKLYNLRLSNEEFQNPRVIEPDHYETITASSEEADNATDQEGLIGLAFDGKPGTIWHSHWTKKDASYTVDMHLKAAEMVNGLSYLPRKGAENGIVTRYEVYADRDGTLTKVTEGTWAKNAKEKIAAFDGVMTNHVQLKILEGHGGFASAAEIALLRPYVVNDAETSEETEKPADSGISDLPPSVDKKQDAAATPKIWQAIHHINDADQTISFDDQWKFHLGEAVGAELKQFDDATWQNVNLPHDYSLTQDYTQAGEGESGYKPGGIGWYRKNFTIGEKAKKGRVMLQFDGSYMETEVFINGQSLGKHPNGYTAFTYDLTDYIKDNEENLLAVKVTNTIPSSRWYSGSGIYRSLQLQVMPEVHLEENGVSVKTPDLASTYQDAAGSRVGIDAQVVNQGTSDATVSVKTTLFERNADGSLGRQVASADSGAQMIGAGQSHALHTQMQLVHPKLWSVDNPNLYIVKTEIYKDGEKIHSNQQETGFRFTRFDENRGFFLNGQATKLKGVSMHHDQGALGAAAYADAIARQFDILKDMGVNAVRVTHNPSSRVMKDIANRKGMLLIDEAFDTWEHAKNGNQFDYARWFNTPIGEKNAKYLQNVRSADQTWAEYDIKRMVRSGVNDPSIIMWSTGNEVMEGFSANVSNYPQLIERLINWIDEADGSRPATLGDNKLKQSLRESVGMANALSNRTTGPKGVVGYNYADGSQYDRGHREHPDWIMYGSETASAINSRGVYTVKGNARRNDKQLTSYDQSKVNWGHYASQAWYDTIKRDFVAGEFVWTGFDYLGEPTPWNGTGAGAVAGWPSPKSSYFGIVDTAGFPKDSFYFYQSQWNDKVHTLHVLPGSWNEEELSLQNNEVEVVVYSDAAKVKLVHISPDGQETDLGTKAFTAHTTEAGHRYQVYEDDDKQAEEHKNLYLTWRVPYRAGRIKAIAYDQNNQEILDTQGRKEIKNFGAPSRVVARISPSSRTITQGNQTVDNHSLVYVELAVEDQAGELVANSKVPITVQVTGPAELIGMDNGDPTDYTPYQEHQRKAFGGKAIAILRMTGEAGQVQIHATSPQLEGAQLDFSVRGRSTPDKKTITDVELAKTVYVKKGNELQLPQTVRVRYSDHTVENRMISFDENLVREKLALGESFTLTGQVEGLEAPVDMFVAVIDQVASMKHISMVTAVGNAPQLPSTVQAYLADGKLLAIPFPVEWTLPEATVYQKEGQVTIEGRAQVLGDLLPVKAFVRIAQPTETLDQNVAPSVVRLTEDTEGETSDTLEAIKDQGLTVAANNSGGANPTIWSNYASSQRGDTNSTLTFEYDTAQNISQVDVYYATDTYALALPKSTTFSWKLSGESAAEVIGAHQIATSTEGRVTKVSYKLDRIVPAVIFNIHVENADKSPGKGKPSTGIVETKLWTAVTNLVAHHDANLSEIRLGDQVISGEGLTETIFASSMPTTIEANNTAKNVGVTILPANNNEILILTESEDKSQHKTYRVKLGYIPNAEWSIEAGSVENRESEAVEHIKDEKPRTLWHSAWAGTTVDNLYLTMDTGKNRLLSGLAYLPRQDGSSNGKVSEYEVYISSDKENWIKVATGSLPDTTDWQEISFAPQEGRYLKFQALHTRGDSGTDRFMSAAEIRIREAAETTVPEKPTLELHHSVGDVAAPTVSEKPILELHHSVGDIPAPTVSDKPTLELHHSVGDVSAPTVSEKPILELHHSVGDIPAPTVSEKPTLELHHSVGDIPAPTVSEKPILELHHSVGDVAAPTVSEKPTLELHHSVGDVPAPTVSEKPILELHHSVGDVPAPTVSEKPILELPHSVGDVPAPTVSEKPILELHHSVGDVAAPTVSEKPILELHHSVGDIPAPTVSEKPILELHHSVGDVPAPTVSEKPILELHHSVGDIPAPTVSEKPTLELHHSVGDAAAPMVSEKPILELHHSVGDVAAPTVSEKPILELHHSVGDIPAPTVSEKPTLELHHSVGDVPAPTVSEKPTLEMHHSVGDVSAPTVSEKPILELYHSVGDAAAPTVSGKPTLELHHSVGDVAAPTVSEKPTLELHHSVGDVAAPTVSEKPTLELHHSVGDAAAPTVSEKPILELHHSVGDVPAPTVSEKPTLELHHAVGGTVADKPTLELGNVVSATPAPTVEDK